MCRMLWRAFAAFLAVALCVMSLCACGKNANNSSRANLSAVGHSSNEQTGNNSSSAKVSVLASSKTAANSAQSRSVSNVNSNNSSVSASTGSRDSSSKVASKPQTAQSQNISHADELFIGDSRTVGLGSYSGLKSDFFATVGMSIYNINSESVSVSNLGTLTLHELLSKKQYKRVFLMLGINEIGYDATATANKYRALVEEIKEKQPNATIYVQANLHVSRQKSDFDSVINNPALDRYNKKIAAIADGNRVIYLDANPLFDDGGGALSNDNTPDGIHLYASGYSKWAKWIESNCK